MIDRVLSFFVDAVSFLLTMLLVFICMSFILAGSLTMLGLVIKAMGG